MNVSHQLRLSVIVAGMLALSSAHAETMSRADYSAAKSRISDEYKADKAACDKMSGNAKDVCVKEAKGKADVAKTELEYNRSGKDTDRIKVAVAKAEADYAVAKEKCDDRSGNDKDVCVKEAKATETKAKADAKLAKKVVKANDAAADDKSDADYKVATEKCDAMSGDAKSNCIAAAKAKFHKS